MKSEGRLSARWLTLILLLTFAVYAPSVANGFTYDDPYYAKAWTPRGRNPMVAELQAPGEYFEKPMGHGVFEVARGFRPLTVWSYALVHRCFRWTDPGAPGGFADPPWPQHLLNLALHLLATWLAFLLVKQLAAPGPALVAAAVFGLHALRSEVVASIVGRGDLLGFVCGAAAALLASLAPALRLPGVAALAFLAFCSKENAVAWAVMVPLYAFAVALARRPEEALPAAFGRAAPAALSVLPSLALFFLLRERMLAEHARDFAALYRSNPLFELGFFERLPTATMLMGYGLWKVFAPFHLASDYGPEVFRLAASMLDPRVVAALAVLAGALAIAILQARRHPLLLLAAAAFLGFAFVTSNIPVPIETLFAERLYYPAALGLSFLAAWAVPYLPARGPLRAGAALLLGVWLLVSGGLCVQRSLDWHDDEKLMRRDAATQPRSVLLKLSLANLYRQQERQAEAESSYRAALDLNPGEPIALHQLAVMERKRNALDAAEALLRRALASPQIQAAERTAVREELGRVLELRGEPEAACQQYEELRRENPASRLALRRLLALARAAGDWGRVAGLVRTGKRFGPDTPLLSMYQGMLARRAGDWRAAVRAFERSLPELPTTLDEAHGWFAYAESLRALHAENLGQIVQACLKRLELSPELRREFEALLRRR